MAEGSHFARQAKPEELMKRSRLERQSGSFLSRSSISLVSACLRTRLMSWMMVA